MRITARQYLLALLAMGVAACGDEVSPEQQAADNRVLSDLVREANDNPPPLDEVVPEPILYDDIEANDLYGLSCAYAPGTSMGARVIAREVDAFMKIDGELVRFAADPGSRELPANSRTLYNGRTYSLRLEIAEEPNEASLDGGVQSFEGTMWLRDRFDRVIYTGSGTVQCGA